MPSAIQSIWRVSEEQVKVLSKQKNEVLPFSVMLAGPHCQSDRAAHHAIAPTLLSHTMGAQKRCQIIWQVKWDIFIRSSTPSQTGAKVSHGRIPPVQKSAIKMKLACSFLLGPPDQELHFQFISPADYMETNKLKNHKLVTNNTT